MEHRIFISYSSMDKTVADAVCATLEGRGILCWVAPRDVLPGLPYGEAIIEAIEACHVLVLVFSSSANQSPQVMREIERAVSKGILVIPLRIEAVRPSKSLEYFISASHWMDALTPPLEKHLLSLAEAVQFHLLRAGERDEFHEGEPWSFRGTVEDTNERQERPPTRPASHDRPGSKPPIPKGRLSVPELTAIGLGLLLILGVIIGFLVPILQPKQGPPTSLPSPNGEQKPSVAGEDPFVLHKKVVVIRPGAILFPKPEDDPKLGRQVAQFSLFYRLKPDPENPDKELVPVGTCDGTRLGWIKNTDLLDWNTRFVLEPICGNPDHPFVFKTVIQGKEQKIVLHGPSLHQRYYGFVLEKLNDTMDGDNPTYKILLSTANLPDSKGTHSVEPDVFGTKLEIVFVLESTEFLNRTFSGDKKLIDYLKDFVETLVTEATRDKERKQAIRLGFVQYWDNVPWQEHDPREKQLLVSGRLERLKKYSPSFPAKLTCDLTDNFADFRERIGQMEAVDLLDDWPDDVLAGLKLAVSLSQVKWSKQSVKHIILIGSASFQLQPEGVIVNQFGQCKENALTRTEQSVPRGFSSTGLSIERLLNAANPIGDGMAQSLDRRHFHALFVPNKEVELGIADATRKGKLVDKIQKMIFASDKDEIDKLGKELLDDGFTKEQISGAFRHHLVKYQTSLARDQYRRLTDNQGDKGFFREVGPSAGDLQVAMNELSQSLRTSFRGINALRARESLEPSDNPLTSPIWRYFEDFRRKLQLPIIALGTTKLRDEKGEEIAILKVLVSKKEMLRLAECLDLCSHQLKSLQADRKEVKEIVQVIQLSLARFCLGELQAREGREDVANLSDVQLGKLLGDLPFRSQALKVTPRDILGMSDTTFANWLESIEKSAHRCRDIYFDSRNWSKLTPSAVPGDDEYGFFPLHILP